MGAKNKIPRSEWARIAQMAAQGESLRLIGDEFGVTGSAISYIIKQYANEQRAEGRPVPAQPARGRPRKDTSDAARKAAAQAMEAVDRGRDAPVSGRHRDAPSRLQNSAAAVDDAYARWLGNTSDRNYRALADTIQDLRKAISSVELDLLRNKTSI